MAYTFFPTSIGQIKSTLKTDKIKLSDIINIFSFLSTKFKTVKTPINIDPNNISTVNVSRELQDSVAINSIIVSAKVKSIKLKYGNGSSGGRGVKNKGSLFEKQLATALEDYHAGEKIDASLTIPIENLYKLYGLKKYKNLFANPEGEKNVKRPIMFGPDIMLKAENQKGFNLGPIVTDITLYSDKTKSKPLVYLSLKYSGTTTFFNVGVKTILTTDEIKNYSIKNENGNRILKLFNIDKDSFCDVFNGKLKKSYNEDVWNKMNGFQKTQLEKLLQSGIGHGYHVIHKIGTEIKSNKVDEAYMKVAAKPKSCIVYYGGKTGTGKRIDMEISTVKYDLKLNIRDTQGGDGYPTRLMCDFKYV